MNIYSLPSIISFTINFSIAFIVLMENPKASLNRWFSAFIFSFAIWNMAEVIILNSANFLPALFGAQILYRIIFIAPAFFVIIAYLFPKNFNKYSTNPFFYITIFLLPVVVLSMSFPNFQIQLIALQETPRIYHYHFLFNFQPLFVLLLFISTSYVIWGSIVLGLKIKYLRTIRLKNQTRFFMLGMIIIFIGLVAIILLKAGIPNPTSFYFLSTLFTFIIAIFFLIAIVRFHLFKPGRLISGGVTYTVLSGLTFAVYFFIIRAVSASLEMYVGMNSAIFDAVLIVALIFIILPFEKRLQNLFDRWLNKDLQRYRRNILFLFRELQRYYERDDFFKIVTRFIIENFKSSAVYVFCHHHETGRFIEISEKKTIPIIPGNSSVIEQLRHKKEAVEFYELNHSGWNKNLLHFFESINARFFLPIVYEKNLLAIIILCRKKHGLEYNENEEEIISILGSEIAAALRRNQFIEEIREKDRREFQLDKLAAIGRLTASVVHEIRNPLNTISTSAETLLQKDISEADQSELKQFIIEEANRLNRIVSDFLDLARIKPSANSLIDMKNMFERLSMELQNSDGPEVNITYENKAARDKFISEPDLLYHAFTNLVRNAQAAIQERCRNERGFTCAQGLIQFMMRSDRRHFIFSVTDNGAGIPSEAKEFVYDPFFTTKEKGTGLGLSIVRQIVEILSGSVEFISRPGHTCFTIYLPRHPIE